VRQSSKHVCFTHSPTSHLRHFTKTFFVTPLTLHMRHLSCVSDMVGQCLLPQTSSLPACNSALGGLPSGHGILRSGPHVPTYFSQGYIKTLYVKFSYPHVRNEECSYWELPGLTVERTIFLSTPMCAGWQSNCWPFCHPYPHSPYDGYNPSLFAALWLFFRHYRKYLPLGHCKY